MKLNKEFGSDNHSGIHPDILNAIQKANKGYEIAYGEDKYTKNAIKKFKEHFGKKIDVYLVYNGTAANILGLKNITKSYNSIICPETAHLNVHECCGPEKFTGCKLTTIPTKNGKITIEQIKPYLVGFKDPHMAQPKVISITQPTELGTVYTADEIKKLADFAHKNNMYLHMDGARIANAAASLKTSMRKITGDVGIDVLSFGGTKNGMLIGEAVIFFDKKLSQNFEYIRKQGMQLASKMRYLSAQFEAYLSNNLWLKNAEHANKIAKILEKELKKIPEVKIVQKVQANAVFINMDLKYLKKLQKKYYFHILDENKNDARLMCSFNTKKDTITRFVDDLREIISK